MITKKTAAVALTAVLTFGAVLDTTHMFSQPVFTGTVPIFTAREDRDWIQPVTLKEKIRWCRKSSNCSYLARAIVFEARGESAIGQYAVAHVILNRTKHERFPDTIIGVLRQSRQFSFQYDFWKQKKPKQSDWDNAYIVGYDVLNEKVDDPSDGSVYYHTKKVKPRWAKSMEYAMTIDNHIFYREN